MVELSKVVFHRVNYCLPVEAVLPLLAECGVPGVDPKPGPPWAARLMADPVFTSVWRMAVARAPVEQAPAPAARL
jgi:hypothetical protein